MKTLKWTEHTLCCSSCEEHDCEGAEEVEIEHDLPARWELCGLCEGEGKHSLAVSGEGITESEWADWSHEERESLFAGEYDRRCEDCKGSGKILVVDREAIKDPELKKAYDRQVRQEERERRQAAIDAKWGF